MGCYMEAQGWHTVGCSKNVLLPLKQQQLKEKTRISHCTSSQLSADEGKIYREKKKRLEGNITIIVTGWGNYRKLFLLYTFQIFYDKMRSFKIRLSAFEGLAGLYRE